MKEIPLTRGLVAIVDDEHFEFLNQWKWHAHRNGEHLFYARRATRNNQTRSGQLMHRLILETEKGQVVDHINGNGLDNRRDNLRAVTIGQNLLNKLKRGKHSSSQFKGVTWHAKTKKWRASIRVNGKRMSLGLHQTEVEAALAYNEASKKYHGEFGRLNDVNCCAADLVGKSARNENNDGKD